MSNLLRLTKINLLSFVRNTNSKSSSKSVYSKALLLIVGFGFFGYYIYDLANMSIKGFVALNCPYVLLALGMVMASCFILFTNIYKINGILFGFKDYDLLMSLPIKKSIVISSKLLLLYISNLLYTLMIMIPVYLVYINNVNILPIFHLLYFLTLLIIPILPMIISTIIGVLFTSITSRFKHKNIFNMIFTLGFVFLVMYLSYNMDNMASIDIANIGKSLVNRFNSIYPLTNMYINIVHNYKLISLLEYIAIPTIIFGLFILVMNIIYNKVNNNLTANHTKSNYKLKGLKTNSSLIALYKKELKRYFSSINYVLNTAIGAIMLIFVTGAFIIMGTDKLNALLGMGDFSSSFIHLTPLVMCVFCSINCSTHSCISLEGKFFWIAKSIPVRPIKIFMSKIMVNMTTIIPSVILVASVLAIYLKSSLIMYIYMIITPILFGLFISIAGLILNLLFPNFNWKNEIRVIKQSLPSFLAIFIGIICSMIPLFIKVSFNKEVYILLVTIIIGLIDIILYEVLKKWGEKRFYQL